MIFRKPHQATQHIDTAVAAAAAADAAAAAAVAAKRGRWALIAAYHETQASGWIGYKLLPMPPVLSLCRSLCLSPKNYSTRPWPEKSHPGLEGPTLPEIEVDNGFYDAAPVVYGDELSSRRESHGGFVGLP
jgi:hypothetical protein